MKMAAQCCVTDWHIIVVVPAGGGAAIAPPPSLLEDDKPEQGNTTPPTPNTYTCLSPSHMDSYWATVKERIG